jgi:hypothetical protein
MPRKSNKSKTTTFIKIVRSPTSQASSFFRGRGRLSGRLSNVALKLLFTVGLAYAMYSMNHPDGWSGSTKTAKSSKSDKKSPEKTSGGLQNVELKVSEVLECLGHLIHLFNVLHPK